MIFLSAPSSGFVCLQGLGAAKPSEAVKRLQTSLTQLAAHAAAPAIDPGGITGVVDDRTLAATGAALRFAATRVPTKAVQVAVTALSVGLPLAPDAASYVTKAADEISAAINLTIASTKPARAPAQPTGVPWWQTPAGKGGLLALAGILTTVLIMKRYRSGTPRLVAP